MEAFHSHGFIDAKSCITGYSWSVSAPPPPPCRVFHLIEILLLLFFLLDFFYVCSGLLFFSFLFFYLLPFYVKISQCGKSDKCEAANGKPQKRRNRDADVLCVRTATDIDSLYEKRWNSYEKEMIFHTFPPCGRFRIYHWFHTEIFIRNKFIDGNSTVFVSFTGC